MQIKKDRVPREALAFCKSVQCAGGVAYIIGGWVRDSLLGLNPKDIDIEVFGLDVDVVSLLANGLGSVNEVGKSFGILKLTIGEWDFDISIPRTEQKTGKGTKGFEVRTAPDMTYEDAARRRDYTINTMV